MKAKILSLEAMSRMLDLEEAASQSADTPNRRSSMTPEESLGKLDKALALAKRHEQERKEFRDSLAERIEAYGGMGNGERDNAVRQSQEALKSAGWMEVEPGTWAKNPCSDGYACFYPDCPCERNGGNPPPTDNQEGGHPEYRKVLSERLSLHIEKSGGYGNSEDPFANFTAVATVKGQPRFVYPVDRSLEKITRIYSLIAQERYSELEEEFKDVASLLDCATSMLREDGYS